MKRCISLLLIFTTLSSGLAQQSNFSKQDTLRGSITPERVWWDLLHYNLDFKVSPSSKSIEGSNLIRYEVLSQNQLMQIDLQPPMEITSSSGCGLKIITRFIAGVFLSGLFVSSAFGFPPGQPVIVCCNLLNMFMFI